jgi:hypothetical protein
MRKILISCAVVAGVLTAGLGTASAGEPAVQGCVGESVSANARLYHPYGTSFVDTMTPTNDFGSLGDAVQTLQAGFIPNGIGYDNTCNGS